MLENLGKIGFGDQKQAVRQPGLSFFIFFRQAVGTHLNLTFGFFTGNIQNGVLSSQLHCHLECERTFADAWISANQDDRARHDPPAQDACEFFNRQRQAVFGTPFNLRKRMYP